MLLYIYAEKKISENLAKVVSSNISLEDFDVLQKYAKIYYNYDRLKQPTISHLVRYISNKWANQKRVNEEQNRKKPTKLYISDPTYLHTHPELKKRLANKTNTTGV